ncbi:hypothetical protein DL93DRAFT_2053513 [Clavulina sp. PMI_390]|nr:hypothetical protein DL93DRAFT_2053513 [Clavulina sp. PMI_390]
MAQSYFSPTHASQSLPNLAKPANAPSVATVEKVAAADDVQGAYIEQKDRLVSGIDSTRSILTDLRTFNKDSWTVRYPNIAPSSALADTPKKPKSHFRRSLSFADDPETLTEVVMTPSKSVRTGLQRSVTLTSIAELDSASSGSETVVGGETESEAETLLDTNVAADFRVLRLDLKLGAPGSSSAPGALVSQLEKASIANLLDERIDGAIKHVDKLRTRVEDTSSKVLVTGDLNAGKSTFVNALLGKEVMPVDQQPCTTLFCEVHDMRENDGVEEAHVVVEGATYDRADELTYSRVALEDLERLVAEREEGQEPDSVPIKLYVSDSRKPGESLLNNGVVDISLIDAPGLNRDSLKTTAVFARQSEIDVVVFVVSAENHFTLSAKEFLWNASNEKAYLFIVVNRYDQIRDKDKCRRLVLEQIRQLSPHTYQDAEDLVHFVDSSSALARNLMMSNGEAVSIPPESPLSASAAAFNKLESDLRSFVLVKRAKSKLLPASTYLSHILSDVDLLSSANAIVAESEAAAARETLAQARPILNKMQKGRESLEESLEEEEDTTTRHSADKAQARIDRALERVGRGEIGITQSDILANSKLTTIPTMPSYPGLLGLWEYARAVRAALIESVDAAVKLAEDEARVLTTGGVNAIAELGEVHLPAGVERTRRVFMPEAMFVPRTSSSKSSRRRSGSHAVVAGGTQGLGLGLLSHRPELGEVTFVDIIDFHHHVLARFGLNESDKLSSDDEEQGAASALSTLGLGLGAITMVGGKTIGARGVLEGIVRLSDLLGNESTRKWVAPVIGAATLGATVYFVLELPNTIPKTIGRRLKASLARPASTAHLPFAEAHATRIARETRKVLRLAAWDLRERFRTAMEERAKEVKGAEESEKRAMNAVAWFHEVAARTEGVRLEAGLLDLDDTPTPKA